MTFTLIPETYDRVFISTIYLSMLSATRMADDR